MSLFIGGVSELYQGDLDLGRRAVERLMAEDLGPGVSIEDFHYGAVAVAQRLQEVAADALLLVGAIERGRPPGAVERRLIDPPTLPVEELQAAVGDAVTGYVDIDLILKVCSAFGILPRRTVVVEVEPERLEPSEQLSPSAAVALEEALKMVRAEVLRTPLMLAAAEVRASTETAAPEPSPALEAMTELLEELARMDERGRWGATFTLRERLKLAIAEGRTGEGMTGLDWGLWWGLIEELDRLQSFEAGLG